MTRFSSFVPGPSAEAIRSKKHYLKRTALGARKRSLWVAPENQDIFALIQELNLGQPLSPRAPAAKLGRLHEELHRLAAHLRARENPTPPADVKPKGATQGELLL